MLYAESAQLSILNCWRQSAEVERVTWRQSALVERVTWRQIAEVERVTWRQSAEVEKVTGNCVKCLRLVRSYG